MNDPATNGGTMDYEAEILKAETDLAFALAQGDGYAEDAAAARIVELKRQRDDMTTTDLRARDLRARDLRKGDDLFGAGKVDSAVWVGGSVQVRAGGTTFTFWPDEEVTVRRAAQVSA